MDIRNAWSPHSKIELSPRGGARCKLAGHMYRVAAALAASANIPLAAANSTGRVRRVGATNYLDVVTRELKEAWTALANDRCCCKIGSALEATAITAGLCAFDFSDWNLLTTFS